MRLFDYPEAVSGWEATFTRYAMLKTDYGAESVADKMAEI